MYRKRRGSRPWIEENIVSDNKNLISKVVRVLCRSSKTDYGSVVSVVTDGVLKIVAAFSEEAVQSALNDLDGEDNPCWNTALLILHKFSIELRTFPGKDYGEFILYVEKFNIWDLQPGYQAKYDFKYCMENEKIWDKMMAVYAEQKEKRFNSAADTSNTGSVSLTQLLDEMAAPSLDIQMSENDAECTVGIISDSLREKLCALFTVEECLISKEDMMTLDQINEWKPDYRLQSSSENKLSSDDVLQGNVSYCDQQASSPLEDKQSQGSQSLADESSVEPVSEVSPVGLSQTQPSNSLSQEGSQWQEGLDSVRFSFEEENDINSSEHGSPVLHTSLIGKPSAQSTQRECLPSTSVVDELQTVSKVLMKTKGSSSRSEYLENSDLEEYTDMLDNNETGENSLDLSSPDYVSTSDSDMMVMSDYYSQDEAPVKVGSTVNKLRNREFNLNKKREKLKKLMKAVESLSPSVHVNKRLNTCNENDNSKCETQICDREVIDGIKKVVPVEVDEHTKEKESPEEDSSVGEETENAANNVTDNAEDRVEIAQAYSSLHSNKNLDKIDEANSDENVKYSRKDICAMSCYTIHNSDKSCVAERLEIIDSSEPSDVSTQAILNSEVHQRTDNTIERIEKSSAESIETSYPSSAASHMIALSDISTPEILPKQRIQDKTCHSEAKETEQFGLEEIDGKCKDDARVIKPMKRTAQVIIQQYKSGVNKMNVSSKAEKKAENDNVSVELGSRCELESEKNVTSHKEKKSKGICNEKGIVDIVQPIGAVKHICSVDTVTNKGFVGEYKNTHPSPSKFGTNASTDKRQCGVVSTKSNSSDNTNKQDLKRSTKLVIDETVQVSKRKSLRLRNKKINSVEESNEHTEKTKVTFVDPGNGEELYVNPIKNTSSESSAISSFASTTTERIDQKLKRKEKSPSKLNKTNKKFSFKKVNADNHENKVDKPNTDVCVEYANTTVDNKKTSHGNTNVSVTDGKSPVSKTCDKKQSLSTKPSHVNTSHDNLFPKRDNKPEDHLALSAEHEKNQKNSELNDRQKKKTGKNNEGEDEKLCAEPSKETLIDEMNIHCPIITTQPFDVGSHGTQAFTPMLSESPKSDSSSNEFLMSDNEKSINLKKTECDPTFDDKLGVIENLHEGDSQNTTQSFTKITKKPILATTEKLKNKEEGNPDHNESSSSCESIIFSEPQPKLASKKNVNLSLDSRSGLDQDIELRNVKKKAVSPKYVFRVKGIRRKRENELVPDEEQMKKKVKYTVVDTLHKCLESGSDNDCVVIEEKTSSDVDDVVSKNKKIYIDSHCHGSKNMGPNFVQKKVTESLSGEIKLKHYSDVSNRRRNSCQFSQSSESGNECTKQKDQEVELNIGEKTPKKQGQLRCGKIKGQYRFFSVDESVDKRKNIEISECTKVNKHLLKTPEHKNKHSDVQALRTPELNERKQDVLKTPDKTVCGKCTYDVPVVICKKMTPRKIFTGISELDKKSFIQDWLKKHKKISEPRQPEGSQEWALNVNQSDENVRDQSDNLTKKQLNTSEEDLFDFSDSSEESEILNKDLSKNKAEGNPNNDTGSKRSGGLVSTVCQGNSKPVCAETTEKIQKKQKPLSAAEMYLKKFELL